MPNPTGAAVIAKTLQELGVTVIFGLVGVPVADIAEEAISLGIRFIGFRNEQAASYAATAYGYLTGTPGVCLLVGGPGILHGVAGIGNASANAWPTLFLGGSSEQGLNGKGAFQEMDSITLLTPQTKQALRPSTNDPYAIVHALHRAYRFSWYGRPGPTFVDLPADLIMRPTINTTSKLILPSSASVTPPPRTAADSNQVAAAVSLLKSASAPLVVIGKGAAYARSEAIINTLITTHNLPFLPTPMGKGVVPDSNPLNTSSARSAALQFADVVLLLGARLNWILHYGEPPKYSPNVTFIQVDISPEELGRINGHSEPSISLFGDITTVVTQLHTSLGNWTAFPQPSIHHQPSSRYLTHLSKTATRNTHLQHQKSTTPTPPDQPFTYERAYHIISNTLTSLTSDPTHSSIVYISEGANTMDISRASFPLHLPRQRLDAGTYATMGVGMGYALAAHAAYNLPQPSPGGVPYTTTQPGEAKKRIVCLFGDSAYGFSGMEIETLARHKVPAVIFVINNSGIYNGDSLSEDEWRGRQRDTVAGRTTIPPPPPPPLAADGGKDSRKAATRSRPGLKSTSLLWETRYEMMAEMVGGKGFFVKTERELEEAVREGWAWGEREQNVVLVNVVVEAGLGKTISFAWDLARGGEVVVPKL